MDWITPKTLVSADKYRTMVDSIVRNDLLYLYQSTGADATGTVSAGYIKLMETVTLSYSDWLGRR